MLKNSARRPKWMALAVASAAVGVTMVGGVGSAQAVVVPVCQGNAISGQGSSLQNSAQQNAFKPAFTTFCTNVAGLAAPGVTYTSTSSGRGLNAWNANGTTSVSTQWSFIGTDDAATSAQLSQMNKSVANGGLGSTTLTIPIAQTAIAIPVNTPAGCTVNSITGANLEKVFRSVVTSWASIGGTPVGSCSAAPAPVVRADSSGTTYQLKHYLFTKNNAVVTTIAGVGYTWAGLQAPDKNTVWPGVVTASKAGGVGPGAGSGGGDEVSTIANTASGIGYAALPDARSKYAAFGKPAWVNVTNTTLAQNPSSNGLSTVAANSNCATGNGSYGTLPAPTTTWADVYYNPSAQYPICTLTWDHAQADYSPAWGGVGTNLAATVADYLSSAVSTTYGQAGLTGKDYQTLGGDVRQKAQDGIALITR